MPGFQRKWASWIGTPEGRQEIARMSRQESRHHPEMANVVDDVDQIVTPAGGPGDLLIWQNFLPHGSNVNTSAAPRMRLGVAVRPAPPPTAAGARPARARSPMLAARRMPFSFFTPPLAALPLPPPRPPCPAG